MGLAAELWQFGFKRISPAGTDNLVKDLLHKNIEFQTAGSELDQEKSDFPSSFAKLYFEFSSCSRLVRLQQIRIPHHVLQLFSPKLLQENSPLITGTSPRIPLCNHNHRRLLIHPSLTEHFRRISEGKKLKNQN